MPAFAAVVVVAGVWSYNVQSEMNAEASLGAGDEMAMSSLLGGE
jgi:hypothetical protein